MNRKIMFGFFVLGIILVSACTAKYQDVEVEITCEDLYRQITDRLDALNYCSNDNDCTYFPLGLEDPQRQGLCGGFINKKHADDDKLYMLKSEYLKKECGGEVECMPYRGALKTRCVNNKCKLE